MANDILYLDVDDEITSAAGRVRAVPSGRVAVVLPYGSRVATSRINFRLLARDAMTHEKRLSVISSDAATRALAASAGLPVFASVGEYEESLGPGETAAVAAMAGAAADTEAVAGPEAPSSAAAVRRAKRAAAAAAGAAGAAGAAASADGLDVETGRVETRVIEPPAETSRPATVAVTRSAGGSRRTPIAIGLGVLALALLVGAVGAYLFLPSATIVVTPRTETLGPIQLTVVADPSSTEPDISAGTVPAETLSVDVATIDTFPATGKRVEETAATGTVRFQNFDPTASNTVPAGSIVSTSDGVRFRTNKSVTVGEATADLVPPFNLTPREASVGVTAVKPGPDGNVGANTIKTAPRGEGAFLLVNNPEATTGGTREEFPKITKGDVDAALAALELALQAEFEEQLADPALAPPGSTVFPETASLGEATPSVDPAKLVGTEAASFELGLSATGTVVAVNGEPVAAIAETRLRESVASGSELVEGSIEVTVGPAVVVGGQVTFPVTASATQVAVLDPAELEAMVLGKTPEEATAILAPYGTAEISLSPDWVSTIPTFANRVELTVDTSTAEGPAASPAP